MDRVEAIGWLKILLGVSLILFAAYLGKPKGK